MGQARHITFQGTGPNNGPIHAEMYDGSVYRFVTCLACNTLQLLKCNNNAGVVVCQHPDIALAEQRCRAQPSNKKAGGVCDSAHARRRTYFLNEHSIAVASYSIAVATHQQTQ